MLNTQSINSFNLPDFEYSALPDLASREQLLAVVGSYKTLFSVELWVPAMRCL